MRNKNILILLTPGEDFFWIRKICECGVRAEYTYKKVNKFFRALRRLHSNITFLSFNIWFDNWKMDLKHYDIIIIWAAKLNVSIAKWIHSKYPNIRIIFWFWNPIKKNFIPDNNLKKICECWSFDFQDCIDYNLIYNTQFYFPPSNDEILKKHCTKNDIFFIGAEKGRGEILLQLEKRFEELHLNTYFHIVKDNTKSKSKIKYCPPLRYSNVIKCVLNTKCILEILQENQSGFTLRTMEALFYSKKLITNNKDIKFFEFYNPQNIFILGENSISELPNFIKSKFQPIDSMLLQKYTFYAWLNKFMI